MRTSAPIAALTLSLAALCASGSVYARARLLSSTPAADTRTSGVKTLSLVFSEGVTVDQSGVVLVMTGMPGMASHAPMTVAGFTTALSADGRTMTVLLPRALPAGTYRLDWHAVTADTHRSEGHYVFSVR